jgi:type IV secretion system protein VirB8
MDKKKLDTYLRESRSWETSSVLSLQKITRLSLAAGAAGLIVGVLGMALAWVQANKEPPMPLILWGDKALGNVEQIQSLAEGKITVPEASDKYFAWQYVQYRETWSPELAKEYHYRTALMSTDAEQQRYEAFMHSDKSPRKVYGDNAKVHVEYRGTSVVTPGVLAVRYTRVIERPGAERPEVSPHTATVTFGYSSGRMSEYDRMIDPLGFQASDYRTDPEVPETAPVLRAAAANPAVVPASAPAAIKVAPAAQLDLRPLKARGQ